MNQLSLRNIQGQDIAMQYMNMYVEKPHTIPPLLVFHGPSGVGKWSTAERFVFTVLCLKGNGCGNCESCRLFINNQHPDFILFPEEEKILIGKDDEKKLEEFTVRWLLAKRIPYVPHVSKYRMILIPDASLFTDEAESALLKTLEEPPSHTRFIFLIEDLLKLKQPIVSRAICIPFNNLSQSSIASITSSIPDYIYEKYYGGSISPIRVPQNILNMIESKLESALANSILMLDFETWVKNYKDSHQEWDYDFDYKIFVEGVLLIILYKLEKSSLPNRLELMEEVIKTKELLYYGIANLENSLLSRLFYILSKE